MNDLTYRGIPVEEDDTLPDDCIEVSGVDKDGCPITMRFRKNPDSGSWEKVTN